VPRDRVASRAGRGYPALCLDCQVTRAQFQDHCGFSRVSRLSVNPSPNSLIRYCEACATVKPSSLSWTAWSVRLWVCRARRNEAEWLLMLLRRNSAKPKSRLQVGDPESPLERRVVRWWTRKMQRRSIFIATMGLFKCTTGRRCCSSRSTQSGPGAEAFVGVATEEFLAPCVVYERGSAGCCHEVGGDELA